MVWILLSFLGSYFIFLAWILLGWKRLKAGKAGSDLDTFISVVVPVRNEARNIEKLLADLENQDYPKDKFEVIIVDDQSEDRTCEIVTGYSASCSIMLHLVDSINPDPERISSKKQAITRGIRQASGDLIVLTDGDSRLKTGWLRILSHHYRYFGPVLIAGPVFMLPEVGFFKEVQSIEFASLIGSGAGCFSWGYPVMSNGANLAFPRKVFFEVDGYSGNENIISGDDEFLMKKIAKKYPGKLMFLKSEEAIVYTKPVESLKEFIRQRIRWAGKWNVHGNSVNMFLALYVFLIHSGILTALILTISGDFPLPVLAGYLFIKITLEFFLLRDIFVFAGERMKFLPFLTCSMMYSLYAVTFGVLANTGSYSWKGRKYKH